MPMRTFFLRNGLSTENDKIFREELMRDEEIREMKQETLYCYRSN